MTKSCSGRTVRSLPRKKSLITPKPFWMRATGQITRAWVPPERRPRPLMISLLLERHFQPRLLQPGTVNHASHQPIVETEPVHRPGIGGLQTGSPHPPTLGTRVSLNSAPQQEPCWPWTRMQARSLTRFPSSRLLRHPVWLWMDALLQHYLLIDQSRFTSLSTFLSSLSPRSGTLLLHSSQDPSVVGVHDSLCTRGSV
jgi:hypothetical protein